MAELNPDTERALRAANSRAGGAGRSSHEAIVGLGAQLAELRGDGRR